MSNNKPHESVLQALIHYDEGLRSGNPGETLTLPYDTDFLRQFELGQQALNELEAAIPRRSRAMPSWAPKTIGRFQLRSVLGSGGFAVVYLAADPLLNRMVALKVPRPHALVQANLRRQFVIEAQAAAKLDHANIVPVYEAGQDKDLPYIACAWCDGPTLDNLMSSRTSPLKPRLAATIVRQLASAVQCSHDHGILHRDIKPGNILLFPYVSGTNAEFPYVPRLGDFGLAKLMESGELATVSSQLIGTPRYMAPELLSGTQPPSTAADVYALGAVLYCLIVGQPPFVAATAAETFRQIAECAPGSPEIINPGIGRDLSRICMKCLEKSPSQRYITASAFADDLDRYLAGKPVHARKTPVLVRIQKRCRQHPLIASLLLTTGSLVAALLILAAVYTSSQRNLHGQLESRNEELNQAAEEANARSAEANEQRRIAERLLFAADVQHASQILKKGDVRETGRILSRYAVAMKDSEAVYGPDNFAWRFLWNHATTPFSEVYNAGQAVWWMQPSGDGKELAVCGSQGELQFLDIDRGLAEGRRWDAGSTEISCVSYSDDMQLIATASDDGMVRVYDQKTLAPGQIIKAIPGKRAFGVLFLPGSHQVIACGESNSLVHCDADTGELFPEIETPFERVIEFMTLSPDHSRLLMAGSDGQVVQMKVDGFSVVCQREVSNRTVTMARYSHDGTRIVCVGSDSTVHLLDADTEAELWSYRNLDSIQTVLMTPDNYVVIGDRGGVLAALRLPAPGASLEADAWRPVLRWAGHDSPVSAAIWLGSSDPADITTRQIITADRNGQVRSWQIATGVEREVIPSSSGTTHFWNGAVCMAHDRPEVLRAGPNGIDVFSLNSLKQICSHLPGQLTTSICIARASGHIITGNRSGQLRKFSNPASDPISVIPVFAAGAIDRLMTDDKAEFAIAIDEQDRVAVIDIRNGIVVATLENRSASAISPNGHWIASARHGRDDVEMFATGKNMRSEIILPAHRSTIEQVLFSPDSQYLITTSRDRMITVWSCKNWQLLHRLSGHQSAVRAAGISVDGTVLATGDEHGLIKLWDFVGGRELLEMDQPVADVIGLQFSPDGQKLIAWDEALTITVLQSPDYRQRPYRLP